MSKEKLLSQERIDRLMALPGKVRGSGFQEVISSIRKREGEGGVKRLEKATNDLGIELHFNDIQPMEFYPLGKGAVVYALIKEMFDYKEKDFQEMGRFESRVSFIIKLFLKYFFSMERVVEEAPKMWKKYYTVGSLEVEEYDEKEKYAKLVLRDFNYVPVVCKVFEGYFSSIIKMITGKEAICRETKCSYEGDEYHEFLVEW